MTQAGRAGDNDYKNKAEGVRGGEGGKGVVRARVGVPGPSPFKQIVRVRGLRGF